MNASAPKTKQLICGQKNFDLCLNLIIILQEITRVCIVWAIIIQDVDRDQRCVGIFNFSNYRQIHIYVKCIFQLCMEYEKIKRSNKYYFLIAIVKRRVTLSVLTCVMRAQSIQARWRTSVSLCEDSIDDKTALSSDVKKRIINL